MKTCPNCEEILGDSVNVCFKCRYDFRYKRVITSEELTKQRERQIEQQNKLIEDAKLKEEQKKIQLEKNPLYEYDVVIINDLSNGQIDEEKMRRSLNKQADNGWRLHSVFTNEIGKSSVAMSIVGFGNEINSTIDQTILIFERCIKS